MKKAPLPPQFMPYQWHKSAPKSLRDLDPDHDPSGAWSAWTSHLRTRKRPGPIWSCFDDDGVLLWGGGQFGLDPAMEAILDRAEQEHPPADLDPSVQHELDAWLAAESSGTMSAEHRAASTLVWSYLVSSVADAVSPDSWWELLGRLTRIIEEAAGLCVEDHPVVHQVLAGEAALAVAFQFPELSTPREVGPFGARIVSEGLEELHDGQGLLHADYFGVHQALFASWTRSLLLIRGTKQAKITSDAKTQYDWAVRTAFRTVRSDDTNVFSSDEGVKWSRSLIDAALELGGNEEDEAIAALRRGRKRKKKFFDLTPDDASVYSEWAAAALMRPDWSNEGTKLTVLFPDNRTRVELESDMRVLWSGKWDFEVRRNGVLLAPTSDWVEVCWDSDDDADYLELEIDLGADVRMQRAFFLGKEDRVVFLADTLLDESGESPTLEYRGWLPTTDRTSFEVGEESNEGYLRHGQTGRARASPGIIGMAERRDPPRLARGNSEGSFLQSEGRGHVGRCPLVLRFRREADDEAVYVAASHGGRVAGNPEGGRGDRVAGPRRKRPMVDLPVGVEIG